MRPLTPKKIYEKITLQGYQASPEELKQLEGTPWHHKLNNTTPSNKDVYKNPSSFKRFFEEETSALEPLTRSDLADVVLDKVEDKFGLHYSTGIKKTDNASLPQVKEFALTIIQRANAHPEDKKRVASSVNKAKTVCNLLTRLNLLS